MGRFKLVPCTERYWGFVRELRNKLKDCFIEQHTISWSEHMEFMERHSHNYEICLSGEEPIGFVGIVDGDIRIAVDPVHHFRGAGKYMLKDMYGQAKVKIDNEASLKLFKSCGFQEKYIILENCM